MSLSNQYLKGKSIYENPLSSLNDVKDWILEGEANLEIVGNCLRIENKLDSIAYGDYAHWVLWCPTHFPDKIIIEWDFHPIREPGLCMLFFSSVGKNGKDLFDPSLPKRSGVYPEYHSGAMNALHLSYFRHKHPDERAFRTCNLRKSYGFHLVATGADPLPPAEDAISPYKMQLVKYENHVQFSINGLQVLNWLDDGRSFGDVLTEGKIGFRQMAPMIAAYAHLNIYEAIRKE